MGIAIGEYITRVYVGGGAGERHRRRRVGRELDLGRRRAQAAVRVRLFVAAGYIEQIAHAGSYSPFLIIAVARE